MLAPQADTSASTHSTRDRPIALTLSGGGFRATLFHLGVLRCLYEHGLLAAVSRLSAVSGGSVLAAHAALHWDSLKSSFDQPAGELVAFVRSDVRGRILRRWILGRLLILPALFRWETWTLAGLLRAEYERLYHARQLKDLPSASGRRPDVVLSCTSLNTGTLCRFTGAGFECPGLGVKDDAITAPEIRLSLAVAASSAFPPLFPPIRLSHKTLGCDVRNFDKKLDLTDGGVYDNLGVEALGERSNPTDEAILFVSDAGGNLDWDFDSNHGWITRRNIRASELLMKRVGDLVHVALRQRAAAIVASIEKELSWTQGSADLTPETQRSLRNLRTDLNAFSAEEIVALVQHGFMVAQQAAFEHGLIGAQKAYTWNPLGDVAPPKVAGALQGRRRKLGLWAAQDWASWAVLAITLAGVVVAGLGVRSGITKLEAMLNNRDDTREAAAPIHFSMEDDRKIIQPALSRDGTRVAYVSGAEPERRLIVRLLDADRRIELPQTDGAQYPFFSPDGTWIAFFVPGKLKKIAVDGKTAPIDLCDAPKGRGGVWADDGTIVAALNATGGLARVSASGGTPKRLTEPTETELGDTHRWPFLMPGNQLAFSTTIGGRNGDLLTLQPSARESTVLLENTTYGGFVAGHLVYYRAGSLYAAKPGPQGRFGASIPLFSGVAYDHVTGQAQFAVSESGTLAYLQAGPGRRFAAWLGADGSVSAPLIEPGDYSTLRLSPDGTKLASGLTINGRQNLWVFGLADHTKQRITLGAGPDSFPVWSPDGTFLAFESAGVLGWGPAGGGNDPSLLKSANRAPYPWSFSHDGSRLMFTQAEHNMGWQMWHADVRRTGNEMTLANPAVMTFTDRNSKTAPAISPDGRWVAYSSDDSGRYEIYVSRLASPQGKVQVSTGGGRWPVWAGGALFYQSPDRKVMKAGYTVTGDAFHPAGARAWASTQVSDEADDFPAFDVTTDGRVIAFFDDRPDDTHIDRTLRFIVNFPRIIQSGEQK